MDTRQVIITPFNVLPRLNHVGGAPAKKKPAATPAKEPEPATIDEEPATIDDEPAIIEEEPATIDEEPASIDEEPATIEEETAPVRDVRKDLAITDKTPARPKRGSAPSTATAAATAAASQSPLGVAYENMSRLSQENATIWSQLFTCERGNIADAVFDLAEAMRRK